jgi:hypothetical protein
MKGNVNYNFLPAVHCPYCNTLAHPEISGWGGELSTRIKYCRRCGKEYRLVVYAFADTNTENTTCAINNKKERIKYLKQRIKEKLLGITNECSEWAEEYIRTEASTAGRQN